MKSWSAIFVALFLSGCQGSAAYYHRDVQRHVVVLDKREISVLPLGNNLWEAYGGKEGWGSSDSDKQKARQIKAIELISGCLVTSTVYPEEQQKMLLRATVDCNSKPAS